uniref:Methyltransferase-related protein n=1 Tax=Aegilops tauschii subsp. strangulata TaxID=200361 RepID=A0A453HP19_AEGTS
MCPLRVILIFLSATIAGFFLLRGLNAEPDLFQDDDAAAVAANDDDDEGLTVASAAKTGFWTMVDMASGRYLWRTLVAPPAKSDSEKAR